MHERPTIAVFTLAMASCSFLFRSSISSKESGTRFAVVVPLASPFALDASLATVSPSSSSPSSFDRFGLVPESFFRRFDLEKARRGC